MTAPAFTERQIEKAVAGAIRGGLVIRSVEVDPRTGRITLNAGEPGVTEEPDEIGEWLADDHRKGPAQGHR